jgi:hypothetical protein
MDIQSFLRIIFKKINHNHNHYLGSLCFYGPIPNEQILQNIEEKMKYEEQLPHSTIKHILDTAIYNGNDANIYIYFSCKLYLINKIKRFDLIKVFFS